MGQRPGVVHKYSLQDNVQRGWEEEAVSGLFPLRGNKAACHSSTEAFSQVGVDAGFTAYYSMETVFSISSLQEGDPNP